MKTNQDKAPNYLCKESISNDLDIRALDTRKLVTHITELVTKRSNEKQKIAIGDAIPLETLNTLITSWGESPSRKFSRAERHGHINVAIGIAKICKAMDEPQQTETPYESDTRFGFVQLSTQAQDTPVDSRHDFFQTTDSDEEDPNFTLQSIDKNKQNQQPHSALDINEENQWDLVAKGRVLTQAYEKDKRLIDEEEMEQQREKSDTHWQVVNISAGGYCLRWNSDNTSKAQIGELIALQEFDNNHDVKWHIGVIRWMQFTIENGLEIGVQILSPQVAAATAQRSNRLDEVPFDCLMLPGIKTLNQTSSVLLPSHAFKTNDKLVIWVFEHKLYMTLGETKEQTGSFTQFSYINADLDKQLNKQKNKKDSTKHIDDFDELWSSL